MHQRRCSPALVSLTSLHFSDTSRASISHSDLPSAGEQTQTSVKQNQINHRLSRSFWAGAGLTGPSLSEKHSGLSRDVGSSDEQLLSTVHRAAGRTEAVHLRKLLARPLGCKAKRFYQTMLSQRMPLLISYRMLFWKKGGLTALDGVWRRLKPQHPVVLLRQGGPEHNTHPCVLPPDVSLSFLQLNVGVTQLEDPSAVNALKRKRKEKQTDHYRAIMLKFFCRSDCRQLECG